jgi:hypothetical protein
MCWSRREWREELARRARMDEELRELLDREPAPERPTFVDDPRPADEPAEREPVSARAE